MLLMAIGYLNFVVVVVFSSFVFVAHKINAHVSTFLSSLINFHLNTGNQQPQIQISKEKLMEIN